MKHIVLLDDNTFEIREYLSELEVRGVKVSVAENIVEFYELLVGKEPIDLFILDIMIKGNSLAPAFPEVKTSDGMETGVLLAKALRHSDIETPIILFSRIWADYLLEKTRSTEYKFKNIAFLSKSETTSSEFGDFVGKLLEEGKVKRGFFRFLPMIGDALVLHPSFCGFGVDIKKLLKWG